MTRTFQATAVSFAENKTDVSVTIDDCFRLIRDGRFVAITINLLAQEEIEHWWEDPGFPQSPGNPHHHAPLRIASPTLGPLQRTHPSDFSSSLASYFAYAKVANQLLRKTRFVNLLMKELSADVYKVGEWGELLLATRREYYPNTETEYSFEPHVDAVNFGLDDKTWPIKKDYDQISALLTIESAQNNSGIVMWNRRPTTRAQLNEWIGEYRETGRISALSGVDSLTMTPGEGQLLIFSSRHLHAVEACQSTRRTIGTFLVWDEGWKICH